MKSLKFALAATSFCHLRGPSDDLQYADEDRTAPLGITLFGPGTREHAEATAWKQNKLLDRLKRKGRIEETADEKAETQAEFLSRVTKSFDNWGGSADAGTTSKADFKAVYADPEMYIVPLQAQQHLDETANFTPSSPTS